MVETMKFALLNSYVANALYGDEVLSMEKVFQVATYENGEFMHRMGHHKIGSIQNGYLNRIIEVEFEKEKERSVKDVLEELLFSKVEIRPIWKDFVD